MSVTVAIRDAMLASAHAKSVETEDWRDGRGVCAMARFVVDGIHLGLELREYPAEIKPGVVGVFGADYLLETLPQEDYGVDYMEAYGVHDDADDWKPTPAPVVAARSIVKRLTLTRAQSKAQQDADLDAMVRGRRG